MTFAIPRTSKIQLLPSAFGRVYTELSRFVFVVNECDFFLYFCKGSVEEFHKKEENERQARVCRLPLNVMIKVPNSASVKTKQNKNAETHLPNIRPMSIKICNWHKNFYSSGLR